MPTQPTTIDLGYNSKCLKCGKQLCSCEFRQPTTNNLEEWEEGFEKLLETYCIKFKDYFSKNMVKQFISDLRQKDMEELIKYLDDNGYHSPNIKGMINYYYEKN